MIKAIIKMIYEVFAIFKFILLILIISLIKIHYSFCVVSSEFKLGS